MATIRPGVPIVRRDGIEESDLTDRQQSLVREIDDRWPTDTLPIEQPAQKKAIAEAADADRQYLDKVLDRFYRLMTPKDVLEIYYSELDADRPSASVPFNPDLLDIDRHDMDSTSASWYLQGYLEGARDAQEDGDVDIPA